ncbi:MAG TPA: shikimate kinase [Prolixibacteraceae bacterium]|jgi:shikimate kinase|nr:shikimate kinase [Prolixibacteraceae bacterium]
MKVYLIGFMGSGKTHWGRLLSEKLGIRFFDLDEEIVEAAGKPITEIFATTGEEHFRMLEKDVLHQLTERHDSFIMACGGGTPCYFNNIEFMNQAGTSVWINTPVETLFSRLVNQKSNRPLIRDLSDDQLRGFISKKFSDRRMYYEQAELVVDEEPVELDKLIETIFHA